MLTLLEKIIQIPSVTGRQPETQELFTYLEDYFINIGMSVETHASGGFQSLVAGCSDSTKSRLLLQSHMDVVPAKAESFNLVEKDGKLYGRGVYDMKFAAACYMQLVEDLKDELDQYDFGIMLTSDEEVGGENGVGYLLDYGYSAEVCILPDGGNDWALETACNGIWMIELISEGKTAHGSRPWEGDNAIVKLINVLAKVQELFGDCKPNDNSLTVGQISGGEAVNQVPGFARATLDMRFVSQDDYFKYRKLIERITSQSGIELNTMVHTQGCHTDVKNPYVASFISIAEEIRGQPMETCRSFGSTDARFFNEKDIPTIVIRPIGGGHHSDNEWIDKASLFEFYEVLKAYVIATARR